MVYIGTPGERRDEFAADRDAAAECRDGISGDRDAAAGFRDVQAQDREVQAGRRTQNINDRIEQMRQQILECSAHIADAGTNPADCPDLTAAGLAQLRTYAQEQRRIAALHRAAIASFLDEIRREIHIARTDRLAAARDRRAAAQDRHDAANDRSDSASDRDFSARDRAQAAIERQQADPDDLANTPNTAASPTWAPTSLIDRVELAISESRQRIADSRDHLARTRHYPGSPAPASDNADPEPPHS